MLELYAAGGLTPQEREEVELRASASPEVRSALDEACAAMEKYAALYAVAPNPSLKTRVMQQIAAEQEEAAPIAVGNTEEQATVRSLPPAQAAPFYKWLMAASIVLALLGGALSLYFYQQWQRAEARLAGVMASEQRYARNFTQTSQRLRQQEQTIAVLRDADFAPVRLKGVEAHPDVRLTVYWNPQRAQVYVDQVQLPEPPAGKQYQLWALVDGKPLDAGMINTAADSAGLQQMKAIETAQAFAVTLEPEGGSASPTLEQLMVMGEVSP